MKNIVNVEFDNEKYIMCLDMKALRFFTPLYKKESGNTKATFIDAFMALKTQDITAICCLLASMIRKDEKSKPVGLAFVDDIPATKVMYLAEKITECLAEDMPQAEEGSSEGK